MEGERQIPRGEDFWEDGGADQLRVISPSEGLKRQIAGTLVVCATFAATYYGKLSLARSVGMFTGGVIFEETGRKFRCGLILRGLWNVDSTWYQSIPEEYQEHAEDVKRAYLLDSALVIALVTTLIYGFAWYKSLLTMKFALLGFESILQILAAFLTFILAVDPKTQDRDCSS
mmetsp:Transcript_9707/g.17094  ORF Transcript_9707/g.17094 Transcript_9707/m.17094 type:complete len:173 (-) Transcript_9707:106-624(-)